MKCSNFYMKFLLVGSLGLNFILCWQLITSGTGRLTARSDTIENDGETQDPEVVQFEHPTVEKPQLVQDEKTENKQESREDIFFNPIQTGKLLDKTFQIQELVFHHIQQLRNIKNDKETVLQNMERLFEPLKNDLLNDQEIMHEQAMKLATVEIEQLNKEAKAFIQRTQNPQDCPKAKKMHCKFGDQACGFACMFQEYGICMFLGIGSGRVVVWDLNDMLTYPGLKEAYRDPSDTCSDLNGTENAVQWKGELANGGNQKEDIVKVTMNNPYQNGNTNFVPWKVPDKFLQRIQRVHSSPNLWWIGHVMSNMLRPYPHIMVEFENIQKEIKFASPIVGIHYRAGDKVTLGESESHALEDYMRHVIGWYGKYQLRHPGEKIDKRVYLAASTKEIFTEAKEKYPDFQFITAPGYVTMNSQDRKHPAAVKSIMFDTYTLVACDFLVLTLSSNVGRLVDELRQTMFPDPNYSLVSIDDRYWYYGEAPQFEIAIQSHSPPSPCPKVGYGAKHFYDFVNKVRKITCEMEFNVGDIIEVYIWMNKGYLYGGLNQRTGVVGLYPAHKMKARIPSAPYPI
ncbi:alpha-(1,6)-fucosyltransferase-like [Ciona intestinalis]